MISLAVLDMAGTTIRDDGMVERAFEDALAATGLERGTDAMRVHLELVRETMGQSKIDVFRALFLDDESRAQAANRCFEAAFDAAVARGELEAVPGAETALTALQAAGVRVCLTTGLAPVTRDQVLDVLGWRDLVDLVLSAGDGVRGRPYPDLVLAAVLRLRVDAVTEVAVAGDTVSDLVCGTRAGASIVAGVLTGAHTREQLLEAPHTHLLEGIHELPEIVAGVSGALR